MRLLWWCRGPGMDRTSAHSLRVASGRVKERTFELGSAYSKSRQSALVPSRLCCFPRLDLEAGICRPSDLTFAVLPLVAGWTLTLMLPDDRLASTLLHIFGSRRHLALEAEGGLIHERSNRLPPCALRGAAPYQTSPENSNACGSLSLLRLHRIGTESRCSLARR